MVDFDNFAQEVQEKTTQAAAYVQKKAPGVAEKAKKIIDQTQEKAPGVIEQVKESATVFAVNAKELAEDAGKTVRTVIDDIQQKEGETHKK